MSKDDDPLVILVILCFVLFFIFGLLVGASVGSSNARQEAVKAGVAHWVADEKGKPKFEWITKGADDERSK